MLPLRKIYCDNLGLIKKVSYFFTYRLAPIQCVLHSEYDVVNQIFCLLRAYQSTPAILHVKGHQDSKIPYANLPLPAQLNADADHLATRELRELPNLIRHTPLFPSGQVQLRLSKTFISRNLPGAIRKHQAYRTLLPYLRDRFGWSTAITDSVDWDGFAAAYKTCFKQRKFVFKFCMFLLPTGKIQTNGHLFQCPSISRQRWRASTTSSLRKRLESNDTNPILISIMLAGLQSYFLDRPLDHSEFSDFDTSYHPLRPYYSLIKDQESIGWDHFLRGKLSRHWTQLQQDFIWRTVPTTHFNSDAWLRLIIRLIFTACIDLWTIRNNERHGIDKNCTKKDLHAAQVVRDLRALYNMQPDVLAADRDLFRDSLEDHLTDNIHTIQQWVLSHRQIIHQST
jgi:hypothetical protein